MTWSVSRMPTTISNLATQTPSRDLPTSISTTSEKSHSAASQALRPKELSTASKITPAKRPNASNELSSINSPPFTHEDIQEILLINKKLISHIAKNLSQNRNNEVWLSDSKRILIAQKHKITALKIDSSSLKNEIDRALKAQDKVDKKIDHEVIKQLDSSAPLGESSFYKKAGKQVEDTTKLVNQIGKELKDNAHDIFWLKEQKNMIQTQMQKLERLKTSTPRNTEDKALNVKVEKALVKCIELNNKIDLKVFDHPNLEIYALWSKTENLVGKHLAASPEEFKAQLTLLGTESVEGSLNEFLNFSEPQFALDILNDFIQQASELRKAQFEAINAGKPALCTHDPAAKAILGKALKIISAIKLASLPKENEKSLVHLIGSLTEAAIPRNDQVIHDCLYPDCVVFDSTGKREDNLQTTVDRALLKRKQADNEGFGMRDGTMIKERSRWDNVETRDGTIFVKGDYKIAFQTPDGHRVEQEASIDLSPLGELTRDQVKGIFSLMSSFIQGDFFTPSGEVNKAQYQAKLQNYKESLNLTEQQLVALEIIVGKFGSEILTACTSALISVGHENP